MSDGGGMDRGSSFREPEGSGCGTAIATTLLIIVVAFGLLAGFCAMQFG